MKYTEITVEKITNDVWVAKTKIEAPLDCEISMKGVSAENAKEKLIKILKDE